MRTDYINLIHCQVCDEELTDEELRAAPFNKETHEFKDICFECLNENEDYE